MENKKLLQRTLNFPLDIYCTNDAILSSTNDPLYQGSRNTYMNEFKHPVITERSEREFYYNLKLLV